MQTLKRVEFQPVCMASQSIRSYLCTHCHKNLGCSFIFNTLQCGLGLLMGWTKKIKEFMYWFLTNSVEQSVS